MKNNMPEARLCRDLGVEAYTIGNRVVFSKTPTVETAAHEAMHALQQMRDPRLTLASHSQYELEAQQAGRAAVLGGDFARDRGPDWSHPRDGGPMPASRWMFAQCKPADSRGPIVFDLDGHASPRFKAPGDALPAERNAELSRKRAKSVETAIRELLEHRVDPDTLDFTPASFGEGSTADRTLAILPGYSGSVVSLAEAGGDEENDDLYFRRVDIVCRTPVEVETVSPFTDVETIAGRCPARADRVSDRWSLAIDLSMGAGVLQKLKKAKEAEDLLKGVPIGPEVVAGRGVLRNLRTGDSNTGWFVTGGGGAGLEAPLPGASPSGEAAEFRTRMGYTADDFHGAAFEYWFRDHAVGIGVSLSRFRFTNLMDDFKLTWGIVLPKLGSTGGITAGAWYNDHEASQGQCKPDRHVGSTQIGRARTVRVLDFRHSVFFASKKDRERITDFERGRLEAFLSSLPLESIHRGTER